MVLPPPHVGVKASVVITSIRCTLKLADVYDRVVFADEGQES